MISVQIGDRELRMPLTALPLLVIDTAKRKAGAALPKIPICNTVKYFSRGIVFMALKAKGSEQRKEMLMRRVANSTGEKASKPFLIRI
jgi:hypothetical protein